MGWPAMLGGMGDVPATLRRHNSSRINACVRWGGGRGTAAQLALIWGGAVGLVWQQKVLGYA